MPQKMEAKAPPSAPPKTASVWKWVTQSNESKATTDGSQDLSLPKSMIARLSKGVLPANCLLYTSDAADE